VSNERAVRLNSAIKAELAQLVPAEVRDPRVARAGLLTITRVEVTSDGSYAKVGVSFVGGEGDPKLAIIALTRAAPYLRGEVGRRLGLRHAPELRFKHDRSGEYSAHIDALLREDGDKGGDKGGDGK
jgi:ribosome-binding factor A